MSADHRTALLAFLQGHGDTLADTSVCVGFALVVDLVTVEGERGVVTITSDGQAHPAPWHMRQGYAAALQHLPEFDSDEGV